VGPRFEEIEAELAALSELREKPASTIRITTHEHAINAILWPALMKFLPHYPDIKVEIAIDYGLTDIRRASGEGHDRSPYWTGHAYGGRRRPILFLEAIATKEATGPD